MLLAASSPGRAAAHAVPLTMEPGSNAVLPAAPAEVVIRFSERVEPRVSALRVLDARGQAVHREPATVDPADPWRFRVAMGPAGDGTYTVAWRVLSADDGHLTEGAHVFAVGSRVPGAASPVVVATRSSLAVAGRFLLTLGALLLLGAGLVAPAVGTRPARSAPGVLLIGGVTALAGSTLSALSLSAALAPGTSARLTGAAGRSNDEPIGDPEARNKDGPG
jgi:methionine-rich copper-binding protein CopC